MPDNDLIEIQIDKVIPAQKWRVVRLLTRIWEFPAYIPTVKEAVVLEKKQNKMLSRWKVVVENVPVSWVEEDILALSENTVYFTALEGDLAEFKGKWEFLDHPDGTEVRVKVYLKVGIPGIKEFADAYVQKILSRNFEAILEAIERRLISVKYASTRKGETEKVAGFGIIAHLYNFFHLEKCLKTLNPAFKMPSREFLGQLYHITPSFKLCDIKDFTSPTGATASGCVVMATFIPDMMEKDLWAVSSKILKACKIAEKNGMGIVSLAGFTSIVPERIDQEISRDLDVPVTTGNAFTAAMALDGVANAARLMGIALDTANVAIVGGTGDIGSACARVLARQVRQLTITARTRENLRQIRAELAREHKAKILATPDNHEAVKDADIVITAASASASFIPIEWFKPGAIVCDVGYPKNVTANPARDDVFLFSGGLATSPRPISFPIDLGLPDQNTLYGSFAEAIILALEKRYESFSPEHAPITPEMISTIHALGAKHGFTAAGFFLNNIPVEPAAIEKIKNAYASHNQ